MSNVIKAAIAFGSGVRPYVKGTNGWGELSKVVASNSSIWGFWAKFSQHPVEIATVIKIIGVKYIRLTALAFCTAQWRPEFIVGHDQPPLCCALCLVYGKWSKGKLRECTGNCPLVQIKQCCMNEYSHYSKWCKAPQPEYAMAMHDQLADLYNGEWLKYQIDDVVVNFFPTPSTESPWALRGLKGRE